MKQTLSSRFSALWLRYQDSLRKNWFSYALLFIVLAAIWKKHQTSVQVYLKQKPAQVSSLAIGDAPESVAVQFTKEQVSSFYKRFRQTAQVEEQKFGIPARIILAVALVQSKAGTSQAARTKNNYFNVQKAGESLTFSTAWESFRAFSMAVRTSVPKQKPRSDAAWIQVIEESGILFTTPDFGKQVLSALPK